MKRIIFFTIVSMMLPSCAAKFACKDNPNAPGCHSVSGMYDIINKKGHAASEAPEGYPEIIHAGTPIRGQSQLLRVWIAPWVDADDDYHDQEYLYVVLNHGRWFIDAEKKRIESRYAPRIAPPISLTQGTQQPANTPTPPSSQTVPNHTASVLK